MPVVASDVVERPRGAVIFKNRNLDDMEAKVRTIMKRIRQNRRMPKEYVCLEKGGDIDAYLEFIRSQCEANSLYGDTP